MSGTLKIGETTITLGEGSDGWVVTSPESPARFFDSFDLALARAIVEEIPECADEARWEEEVIAAARLLSRD